MTSFAQTIGRETLGLLATAGRGTLLLKGILVHLPHLWRLRSRVLAEMHVVAIGSLPLVVTTSIFVGAVTAVQAVYQMKAYVPMTMLGVVISKSVFIELGPVLTALVVGGRLCASYAAELGTMKVTEQLDAMEMMALDPIRYLAMPRFVAAVLMLPVITVFCDAIAILGGWAAAIGTLEVTSTTFLEGLRLFFKFSDLGGGLIKSFFFGGIIALSGIFFGLGTRGGAEGVGRATMQAVVASCLSILVADYVLAVYLFQVIFE